MQHTRPRYVVGHDPSLKERRTPEKFGFLYTFWAQVPHENEIVKPFYLALRHLDAVPS